MYRINESEIFNLESMYEHLTVLRDKMEADEIPFEESIYDRVEEVEQLLEKVYSHRVDLPTLHRIREIQLERQIIRYTIAVNHGASEKEAGNAFL